MIYIILFMMKMKAKNIIFMKSFQKIETEEKTKIKE